MRTKIIYILFFSSIFMLSCRSNPQAKTATPAEAAGMPDTPAVAHLIADYSGMKEETYVASAWIAANFSLDECAEVNVQPVLNLSSMRHPHAQDRIEASLRDSMAAKKKNPAGTSVIMTAAITAMRGKPGFIKRFSPTYDDMPSVELEVVVSETNSKRELVKFCHMARGKNTDAALDKLLRDVNVFVEKRL